MSHNPFKKATLVTDATDSLPTSKCVWDDKPIKPGTKHVRLTHKNPYSYPSRFCNMECFNNYQMETRQ